MRKFRSQRIARRHKRIFWTKFVFFWLFLIGLIFLISFISKQEKINISQINIKGNKIVSDEKILEIVNKNTEGDYFWLFPKSNIFLYPKNKIRKEILNSLLRIEDLVISLNNLQSININIVERKPFALYCKNTVFQILQNDEVATSTDLVTELPNNELLNKLSNQEDCYFIDEHAYIYAEASSFSNNVYFKFEEELDENASSTQKILGKTFLKGTQDKQFEKVNLFIRFLKDINIDVYRLVVKKNGDYELSFGRDSVLIFDEDQDFDILLENLQAVLINLGDIREKEFEYIDLRFDNKVLYKFRE